MNRAAVFAGILVAGCGTLLGVPSEDDPASTSTTGVDAASDVADEAAIDAAANDGGAADATADVQRRRVVFVTERTLNGAFGGIAIADEVCNAEASDAGVPGTFVAWLSTSGTVVVDAKSRLVTDAGWSLVDGGEVFSGPGAIKDNSYPKVGINQTARGVVVEQGVVWTGTRQDGTIYGKDCGDWKQLGFDGVKGTVGATDETWTGGTPQYCDVQSRLICFEK